MNDLSGRIVFVVHNPKKGQTWVFDNHTAALECRREQGLNHEHLWGSTVNCYKSMGQSVVRQARIG